MNKRKTVYLLVLGFFASQLFTLSLVVINNYLFIQDMQIEKTKETLSSGDLQVTDDGKLNVYSDKYNVIWPWESIVFCLGVYSAYWFMFGRIYRKKLPIDKWTQCLIIPFLMGILALNPYYLVYIGICYGGGRLGKWQ